MKCEPKGTVNTKLQEQETFKFTEVIYITQAVNNTLSFSRLVSKEATMGSAKDKMTINKNGFNMIMDARKGKNERKIFYLKAKR